MLFAGLVDATRRFHEWGSWPFKKEEFGELYMLFPADVATGSGGSTTIKIKSGQLKDGWVAIHEYGHVLGKRVSPIADQAISPKDLTPCGVSDCDSWNRTGEREYKSKAWQEGFADFAAHIVLNNVASGEVPEQYRLGCSVPAYDNNTVGPSAIDFGQTQVFCTQQNGICTNGAQYPTNVSRALCDWFDKTDDDDSAWPGAGDYVNHDLKDIHDTLQDAFDNVGESQLQSVGFRVCDFVEFYLQENPSDVVSHVDLIYNNGFSCGY